MYSLHNVLWVIYVSLLSSLDYLTLLAVIKCHKKHTAEQKKTDELWCWCPQCPELGPGLHKQPGLRVTTLEGCC